MAELSLEERLQPSLLDRLTDLEPSTNVEPRSGRVLSIDRLKRSVLRDLGWLLNCGRLSITEDLSEYPEVAKSVLNYGASDHAGTSFSSVDINALEREIRQTIIDFEPRLIAETLRVKVNADPQKMNIRAVSFLIEGQLWAQPLPVSLFLSTDIELETGSATVREATR
jgi:type VI secretion system protein ImpF